MKTKCLTFVFDPKDLDSMHTLMNQMGDSETMFLGTNENGESITLSIYHDRIICVTCQKNGWMRRNDYWADGTVEETFPERWNK